MATLLSNKMIMYLGCFVLLLATIINMVEAASTPPGIAKNPARASCKLKKYKMCYNLEHVCPKFCPDSCEVECASCKPICSGGSSPPPPVEDDEGNKGGKKGGDDGKDKDDGDKGGKKEGDDVKDKDGDDNKEGDNDKNKDKEDEDDKGGNKTGDGDNDKDKDKDKDKDDKGDKDSKKDGDDDDKDEDKNKDNEGDKGGKKEGDDDKDKDGDDDKEGDNDKNKDKEDEDDKGGNKSGDGDNDKDKDKDKDKDEDDKGDKDSKKDGDDDDKDEDEDKNKDNGGDKGGKKDGDDDNKDEKDDDKDGDDDSKSSPPYYPPSPTAPSPPTPTPPSPSPSTPTTPTPSPQPPTPSPSTPTPPSSPPTTPIPSPKPSTPSPPTPTLPPSPSPPTTPTPSPKSPTTVSPPNSGVSAGKRVRCKNKNYGQCYNQQHRCPANCPTSCQVDCVTCKAVCSCDYPGAVCQDPRFIGGDGITFYFHGKKNQDFCLVTDRKLHINAHFIGKRNRNSRRDFTWVESIGILFENHRLFVGAKKTSTWDDANDRLSLDFDGVPINLDQTLDSEWRSTSTPQVSITRTNTQTNNIVVQVQGIIKITAQVVPITEQESRVHNYGITKEDCLAHLDLGFKFLSLTGKVDGVLGKTYREDYVSKVNVRAAMSVMGGEKEYESSGIFATDCLASAFNNGNDNDHHHGGEELSIMELADIKCATGMNGEPGIVCKR